MRDKQAQSWSLFKEVQNGKEVYVIRRWNGTKYERLPVKEYGRFRNNPEELLALLLRLNHATEQASKEKQEIRHAFINEAMLKEYSQFLQAQIPSPALAQTEFNRLRKYCLQFFINELDLSNPLDWMRVHETKWANFLTGKKVPKSAKAKQDIIQGTNRFMGWLHKQRPEEVPLLEFKPISPAKYKKIEADREMHGEVLKRSLIKDADWKKIRKKLPKAIEAQICLGYYYGLRRSETMGVAAGDVRKDYLSVERQVVKITEDGPLKGRKKRKVNHWFAKAKDAYSWVETVQKFPMHPRTLSKYWDKLMKTLKLEYTLHDLRHTFITKAVRKYEIRDVQLAAGHAHISTTMRYLHDDRTLGDQIYIP